MNNYISCWISGGLGNQLFQIATCLEYKRKYNKELIFKKETDLWHPFGLKRKTIWNTLLNNNIKTINEEEYNKISFNNYMEINNKYNEIPFINNNVYLRGYFQSPKYISEETKKEINDLVYSNKVIYDKALDLYNKIKFHYNDFEDDNYLFIHFRRTDYINNPIHTLLSIEYYNNAIKHFKTNKHTIIFSDDIEWCKNNIMNKNYYFIDINDENVELILMSFIKNGIIANSTFSWWGSYLGKEGKTIIAPKEWYKKNNQQITDWSDIYYYTSIC